MSKNAKVHLEEISIRKSIFSDIEAVADVHVRAWQESYKNIIDDSYLHNISLKSKITSREKKLQNNSPDKINLVAIYQGKIIGFCDAGPSFEPHTDYLGEIYAIYLLEEFKGIGIGKQLLRGAVNHLKQKILLPYIIWVLKDNKIARAFYENEGGILLGEKATNIGGKDYIQVSYIFK